MKYVHMGQCMQIQANLHLIAFSLAFILKVNAPFYFIKEECSGIYAQLLQHAVNALMPPWYLLS